ncbi:MAG: Smr/MutS family protein [Verrucomicrobiota bacterium]|jgi:DNA-nicking Smr family endonuclease
MSSDDPNQTPVPLPIDGVLDLHTFNPREIGGLVPVWLDECRQRGILEVRIIHGKGIGNLQRTVHAILARRPDVVRFSFAAAHYGGRGATIATLRADPAAS